MKTTMISFTLLILIFAPTTFINAISPPQTKEEYCHFNFYRGEFGKLLLSQSNMLFNRGDGGIFQTGVCWWHSMLTRNATYLAIYKPDLPKPNKNEVRKIINHLMIADAVTIIPGFKNLYTFSHENAEVFEDVLTQWQITEGGLSLGFLRGFEGSSQGNSQELKKTMKEINSLVMGQGRVAYLLVQIPGIDAHSLLVAEVERTYTGYQLTLIDSNEATPFTINYTEGDSVLKTRYNAPVYVQLDSVHEQYKKAGNNFCQFGMSSVEKDLEEAARF